jgi:uncharacterized NAD(P)/FAD-binding protein YdhS
MPKEVALVGAGIVGLGVVARWAEMVKAGQNLEISQIDILDKASFFGPGLPYSSQFVDDEHVANITGQQVYFLDKGDYLKYIAEHKDEIRQYFQGRFHERFKAKFRKRFAVDYVDESSLEGESAVEKMALRRNYDAIWNSFEKRYLNLDIAETYHPRILIGIYANFLFEQSLKTLEESGIRVNCHHAKEVSSVSERADKVEIRFNGQTAIYDNVILAVGRKMSLGPEIDSPRYLKSMWPSDELVTTFRQIAEAEIAKRIEAGNQDDVIEVGIIGCGLSALDAMKSALRDCVTLNEDGRSQYCFDHNGFKVRCTMMSRSGIVPSVDGKSKYDVFVSPQNVPANIAINKETMRQIAKLNGSKNVRLWQAMIAVARSLYIAYREGENDVAAVKSKEMLQFLLSCVQKDDKSIKQKAVLEEILNESSLDNVQFIDVLTKRLGLSLDGFDYPAVIEKFAEIFADVEPKEMLGRNLANADLGDINGGYLIWRDIMAQIHLCGLKTFLSEAEMDVYESPKFNRLIQSWVNSMPLQSATYMLEACEAGILDIVSLGEDYSISVLDDGRIRYSINGGNTLDFDTVINASGYELDIRKHKDGIFADMAGRSEIALTTKGVIDKRSIPAERKIIFASEGASLTQAFARGNLVAVKVVESKALKSPLELDASLVIY